MENKANILLSICIPTFNRANFLKRCLESIFLQITDELPIEIIVSDNGSPDETPEIINKYKDNPKLKSFRHPENIGPMKNCLYAIRDLAKGEFCWIIGDDDYIIKGGIEVILNLLKTFHEVDFIYAKVKDFEMGLNLREERLSKEIEFEKLEKFELLLQPKYSKIFVGELMAGIFRRKIWLEYKDIYNKIDFEYLTTLETSYTHCVVHANQFLGKKAIYISSPIVIADFRAREWSDKSNYLVIEHLYSLIQLYRKNGLKGKLLRLCKYHYLELTFVNVIKLFFNKEASYREKISFKRYIYFLIINPLITIKLLLFIVIRRLKKKWI